MEKKERIDKNNKDIEKASAELCFDFLWMEIEKVNGSNNEAGIVTIDQLKEFAEKVYLRGFESGALFERSK